MKSAVQQNVGRTPPSALDPLVQLLLQAGQGSAAGQGPANVGIRVEVIQEGCTENGCLAFVAI
jgi:hypothetical protein